MQRRLGVAGEDRHLLLGQDRSFVDGLRGHVDRRAGDLHTCSESVPNGVPALESGQKRRVCVEHPSRESGEHLCAENSTEARHRNDVDLVALQYIDEAPGIGTPVKGRPIAFTQDELGRHAAVSGNLQGTALAVGHHDGYFQAGLDDRFQDRAAARSEDSQAHVAATAQTAHEDDPTPCTGVIEQTSRYAPTGMSTSHLIHSYGYLAVFVFVAIESLGVPIPGESAVIAAGAYAGETHKLNPWLLFLVAALAAILGNIAGYSIGRKGGFPLALRYGSKIRLDQHKLKVGKYVLDEQGAKVVFFGRFVSVLRTYVAFLAGTLQMQWQRFALATVAAAVAWAGIYTALAYYAAGTLKRLSGIVDVALGGVALVVVVAFLFVVRHQVKRLGDRAEAAYPGPLV